MGRRAYAIYLSNTPIIYGLLIFAGEVCRLNYYIVCGIVAIAGPVLVLFAADILHRYIEAPFVSFAAAITRSREVQQQVELVASD